MEKIEVAKAELLEKIQQNRSDHRAIFEEALEGFRRDAEQALERMLAGIRAGRRADVSIGMSLPRDHTGDYDRAIAMVQMSIGDTVTLSEEDFAQYVMDDWGWQRGFLSNTYGSSTAVGKFSDRYNVQ